MTAEEKIALLREFFSEAIEEYKEVREEVGDSDYLGGYMLGWIFSAYMDHPVRILMEMLADD